MTDNAVRLTYPQYRAVRRLVHDCCNYDGGNCVLCGGWYIPKSNRAKYCPECAKEEERRKTRERVRRHRAAM